MPVIVKMTTKYHKYNEGELVTVADHVAEQWCGEINRNFQVAVRLPDEDAAKYFAGAPVDKMVGVADVAKTDDTRGPGRSKTKG